MQCIIIVYLGDCGQLPSKRDVYTILNNTSSTIEDSIIQFECVLEHPITGLNKTHHQARCSESGLWHPHPQTMCGHITAPIAAAGKQISVVGPKFHNLVTIQNVGSGYLIRTIALGVGVPLILACLCFVGIAAAVLSCLAIRRNKGKWVLGIFLTHTNPHIHTYTHSTPKGSSKQEDRQRYSGSTHCD